MQEDKKHIYVCLSEDEQVVKVGITYNLTTRVSAIKNEAGIPYKVLFCSELVLLNEAKEVEKKVNTKFKDCVIKGNEWYNIKPILIIEYLIYELGIKPFKIKDLSTEFTSWEETSADYNAYKEGVEFPLIKEKPQKGFYSISYLNGSKIDYIGFCNYGDAKKFYFSYKHFIIMADELVNILYSLPRTTFSLLRISPKKEIYNIRKNILEIREDLLKITDV